MIEPETRTLEAFALDRAEWKLAGTWHGDARVRAKKDEKIALERAEKRYAKFLGLPLRLEFG